jgi:hypothetical protein
MMRKSRLFRCLPLALLACSSDTPQAPILGSQPDLDAGTQRPDGSAVVQDGGKADSAVSAGDGGSAGDAGRDAGAVMLPPLECTTGGAWGAPQQASFSTAAEDGRGALGGFGRTFAWTTVEAGNVRVHSVDRSSEAAAWDGEKSFTVSSSGPGGIDASERIAMNSDGLSFYAVAADGRSLVEFVRAASSANFVQAAGSVLQNLNNAAASMPATDRLSDVVIGASGRTLLYRQGGAGLRASNRLLSSDVWPSPTPYLSSVSELATVGGKARRPTGLARDRSALFYWDEVTQTERAAYFPQGGGAPVFADLGARKGASPNGACNQLFFEAPGTTGVDIFFSTKP